MDSRIEYNSMELLFLQVAWVEQIKVMVYKRCEAYFCLNTCI